jgi:LmbE family N-acetylglucosaminyl deacetylase
MTVLTVGCLLALAIAAFGAVIIVKRDSAYRQQLKYDPAQDHVLGVVGPRVETISIRETEGGFILPKTLHQAKSGLLEVQVQCTLTGRVADPAIEIRAAEFRDIQYLERGARGARFLNVSRLLAANVAPGEPVSLTARGLSLNGASARLHLFSEIISDDDRVVIVAPHPDDAEIAAFGLYTDTRATVVTLTAGDASDRYRNAVQPQMSLSRDAIAKIRVWDSLTIPQLGGVPSERTINLCFPDGRLADMRRDPDGLFERDDDSALDFSGLRELNTSSYVSKQGKCTWRSMVKELESIIARTKPTILVVPHPLLDPHPDHLSATIAVSEAVEAAGLKDGRMFLYTVHNRRSELWPYGAAGSGVALLPVLETDGICGSGFYSHRLSLERQRQKFVALEAMHDLREMQFPVAAPRQIVSRIWAELRSLMRGLGVSTSYLRRATRPDELFFVASFEEAAALTRRAMQ